MKNIHRILLFALLFSFATTRIHGQAETCNPDEECGCAYLEGRETAHWSVYIPIALLVAAAIWFGVSDRHHKSHDYSDSQDALGSIDNSKRHRHYSGSYRDSGSYRVPSYSRSKAGYSH